MPEGGHVIGASRAGGASQHATARAITVKYRLQPTEPWTSSNHRQSRPSWLVNK
jgi:hypothetical protein